MKEVPSREALVALIVRTVEELNNSLPRRVETSLGDRTELFGRGGPLDSIALVTLIIDVETAIEEHFGFSVLLADERAMSKEHSPFRTIESLAAHAEALMKGGD